MEYAINIPQWSKSSLTFSVNGLLEAISAWEGCLFMVIILQLHIIVAIFQIVWRQKEVLFTTFILNNKRKLAQLDSKLTLDK